MTREDIYPHISDDSCPPANLFLPAAHPGFLYMLVVGTGELIAQNTVATGKTPMATDTPVAATQIANASMGAGASSLSRTVTAGTGGVTQNLLTAKDTSDPTLRVLPASGGCGGGFAASTATVGNTFEMYVGAGMVLTGVADNAITAGHILVGGTSTLQLQESHARQGRPGQCRAASR